MNEESTKEVPDAVREILRAMLGQAVSRCAHQGIALSEFYSALLSEQKRHPRVSAAELLDRTFRQLERQAN
jgi:hypothetical protein